MKTVSKDEAKKHAKTQSLDRGYKDVPVYVIYCNRTKFFYVDTDAMIRMWEQLVGYYVNGVYTAEKSHS